MSRKCNSGIQWRDCVAAVAGGSADVDGDGVRDELDNCTDAANGPLAPGVGGNVQRDTNGDGFGNICDADLDGVRTVDLNDFSMFRTAFGTTDADADFDGDGDVDLTDFSSFRGMFGSPPGPSGLNP